MATTTRNDAVAGWKTIAKRTHNRNMRINNGRCVYCNVKMVRGTNKPHNRSVEHLNHRRGEVPYNLVSCCRRCNSAKAHRPLAWYVRRVAKRTGENTDAIMRRIRNERRAKWK